MIVVDASAALSLMVQSQLTSRADEFFISRPAPLTAPAIFPYEVRNSLLKLERHKGIPAAEFDKRIALLDSVIKVVHPVLDHDGLNRVATIARSHGLNFYDAAYLELALSERYALASRDGPLLDAAKASSIEIFDLR